MPASMRVVVVGFGPVAVRFAEELLPQVRDGLVALTMIGAERDGPVQPGAHGGVRRG